MNEKDFKKLWERAGDQILKRYEETYGVKGLPFNTVYPEFRRDGSLSCHLLFVEQETADVKEDKDAKEDSEEIVSDDDLE